jgi:hypothetical protein
MEENNFHPRVACGFGAVRDSSQFTAIQPKTAAWLTLLGIRRPRLRVVR